MSPPRSVMVVDDNEDVRDTIADILQDHGYAVSLAEHGRDALEMLRAGQRPDVILLDMMMPVMDGWQFRAEQQRDPMLSAIPVVFFTAYDLSPELVVGLDAEWFLRKPMRLDQLLTTIAHAMPSS